MVLPEVKHHDLLTVVANFLTFREMLELMRSKETQVVESGLIEVLQMA